MKRLSVLLLEQQQQNAINNIDSDSKFSTFVHEKMSNSEGYDADKCNMIVENLLSMYPAQYQKAITELENFTMHR
jgi:hypothetical protein